MVFLYNDAYRPVLGKTKHPSAMGSRTEESFAEVWNVVSPLFHRVYAGESVALEDSSLPLDRNGFLEEAYFTLSYSPVDGDDGEVGGVLGVVHETTAHVLANRRLRVLHEFSRALGLAESVDAVCDVAARCLEANPADCPFVLIYLLDEDGTHLR